MTYTQNGSYPSCRPHVVKNFNDSDSWPKLSLARWPGPSVKAGTKPSLAITLSNAISEPDLKALINIKVIVIPLFDATMRRCLGLDLRIEEQFAVEGVCDGAIVQIQKATHYVSHFPFFTVRLRPLVPFFRKVSVNTVIAL